MQIRNPYLNRSMIRSVGEFVGLTELVAGRGRYPEMRGSRRHVADMQAVQAQTLAGELEALLDELGIGAGAAHPRSELGDVERSVAAVAELVQHVPGLGRKMAGQPFGEQVLQLQRQAGVDESHALRP